MTATDELRRMLDERGVEWWEMNPCKIKWNSPILGGPVAARYWNGEMVLDTGYIAVAPEQAIEATLGRGTCHNAMPLLSSGMPYPDSWMCSECGGRMDGIILETGSYCPNCGRKVVEQ